LRLPLHYGLAEEQVAAIVAEIQAFFRL
jgi:hypothetical protein